MSDFYPVLLNNENNFPNDDHETKPPTKNDNASNCSANHNSDVIIKIRDHEVTDNTFVRYSIEVYIKHEVHFWFEKTGERSWNVQRRFSDFDSLRKTLIQRYPACLVPPLPSKVNSLIPWRVANQINDSDFIDSRRQRLESFLTRLIAHPKLGKEVAVLEFVRPGNDWSDCKLTFDRKLCGVVNWRWINVQSRLIQVFDSTNSSPQLNEMIKSKSLCNESLKVVERGRNLQENIETFLSSLCKLEEQTSMMHKLYKNYGEAFYDWCANEPDVGDSLQSFSHLCDNFSNIIESPSTYSRMVSLSDPGSNGGSICNGLSWYEISLLLQELYDYGESWIELGGRMALLSRKIKRQSEAIEDLNNQIERLRKGESLKSGPLSQLKNKFAKPLTNSELTQLTSSLESELYEYNKALISLKDDRALFDKCVDEEVQYFEGIRYRDLRLVMHSYAGNQLAYSHKCLKLWKRAKQAVE